MDIAFQMLESLHEGTFLKIPRITLQQTASLYKIQLFYKSISSSFAAIHYFSCFSAFLRIMLIF